VTFLLDHINAHVHVERSAYFTLLHAIENGFETPERLDKALGEMARETTDRELPASFIATQRSGAISRMADLGLVARQRTGVRVAYIVTNQGHAFMRN
jgi:hypothetical protein